MGTRAYNVFATMVLLVTHMTLGARFGRHGRHPTHQRVLRVGLKVPTVLDPPLHDVAGRRVVRGEQTHVSALLVATRRAAKDVGSGFRGRRRGRDDLGGGSDSSISSSGGGSGSGLGWHCCCFLYQGRLATSFTVAVKKKNSRKIDGKDRISRKHESTIYVPVVCIIHAQLTVGAHGFCRFQLRVG